MRRGVLTLVLSGAFVGLYSTGLRTLSLAPRAPAQIEPRTIAPTAAWEFDMPDEEWAGTEFAPRWVPVSEQELAFAEERAAALASSTANIVAPDASETGTGWASDEFADELAVEAASVAAVIELERELAMPLPGIQRPVVPAHTLVAGSTGGALVGSGIGSIVPAHSSAHTVILPRAGALRAAHIDTSDFALALSYHSNRNGYIRKHA